ncbi:hypothetical protein ACJDU8_02230 [Clostridium sp. WILCCON 0269]|uniref:Bypass of forespore C C-terminal domain-containing protein n=1 Tax=Candidatus Clostridium eludens TaxID=3381663 RepID=A0ABW8SEU5_9CLOT
MDRRKLRTIVLVIFTILIFSLSCYICVIGFQNANMKKELLQVKEKNKSSDTVKTNSNVNMCVSDEAELIFKIKYDKSGDYQVEKEESAKELSGKSKSEVEDMYKDVGYKIQTFNSKEIILTKEVDKYAPNKYVLGIKGDVIAIYKTDKEGNMFIENEKTDITDIKIKKLKEEDIKLLTKGDKYFQCNTREEAQSRLEDYE